MSIPMKTFVTGATGFLGSHLVDRLLEKKHEVHVLVRKSSNLRWLLGKKVHYHYGDIVEDLVGLKEALQKTEVCFHLAGVITAARPETYHEVNAQGTANLLEAALQAKRHLKKIVVVTSIAAHGPGQNQHPITEEDDCHPITDYGRSKRDAELIALRYCDQLPITIVRPPPIYGPRDRHLYRYFWMARKGFLLLPGNGQQIVNLAYVQDVITGILLAAEHPRSSGEIFFIGDEKNYAWREIADMVAHSVQKKVLRIRLPTRVIQSIGTTLRVFAWITGRSELVITANMKNFVQSNWSLDIAKARQILAFQPTISLQQGVKTTASWYVENGWL